MKKVLRGFALYLIPALLTFSAHSQNYDEAKVAPYVLPSILKTIGGDTVRSVKEWENVRRAEILSLFASNVYGQLPSDYDSVHYVFSVNKAPAMNGKAFLKQLSIVIWRNGAHAKLDLVLFVPAKTTKPPAVFLFINNRGRENTDPSRKTKSGFWPAEQVIESGYAIAAFHVSEAAPDNKDHFHEGVLQLYPEQLKRDDGMRAIGAWAWASSRILDYFQKDKDIDGKNVFIVGHSRGGKAALWAGANDTRFAMVFSNCSGNTGAALSRRQFGETVLRINTTFPHWFNERYKTFNDRVDVLPVDQHMLLALIAPRPLYSTNATKDLWADPTGSYLSVKLASQAYGLYSKKVSLPPVAPSPNSQLIAFALGYHNREGVHDCTPYDWDQFIRFADTQLRK